MKKLLLILIIPLIMGASCSFNLGSDDSDKVKELEQKVAQLEAEEEVITEEATSTEAIEDEVIEKEPEVQIVEKIVYKETPMPTPTPEPAPQPQPEPENNKLEELQSINEFVRTLESVMDQGLATVELLSNGLQSALDENYSSSMMYFQNAKEISHNAYLAAQNTKIDYTLPVDFTSQLMPNVKNATMQYANKNELQYEAYRLYAYYMSINSYDTAIEYSDEADKLHNQVLPAAYEYDAALKPLLEKVQSYYK